MNVLVTANYDESSLQRLRDELDARIDYRPISERTDRLSEDELIDALDGIDVLIVGYESVSERVLAATDNLSLIACTRGGPEANIDIGAATERDIPVLYTPGRNAVSVADFTMGILLSVARNIAHSYHLVRTGTYTGEPEADAATGGEREDVMWDITKGSPYVELQGPELAGKTLGIVGLGNIGRKVATRAAGFGVDIMGYDPFVDADEMRNLGIEKTDLQTLCTESDFVTVHVVVTEETRGLIGAKEFALMSEDTYFVNTARAAIVDQAALTRQLRNDRLAGAALDVFAEEPLPEDHDLLALPNVVTTPHLAGAGKEVIDRQSAMLTADILASEMGGCPEHVANPSVLDADPAVTD